MASERGYVNIKTADRTVTGGTIAGKEISVAFPLYSDVHKISGTDYQTFPSEKPAYATVFEEDQREAWIAANEELYTVTPSPTPPSPPAPPSGE